MKRVRIALSLGVVSCAATGYAQVPDLLTAFDAGSASAGAGGAFQGLAADPSSAHTNPAGLGYAYPRTLQLTRRNVPESRSSVSGNYNSLVRSSTGDSGTQEFTSIGYTLPASAIKRGAPGMLAFTYHVGGPIDDLGSGPSGGAIPVASGLNVINFQEERHARTEFYTIAYGRTYGQGNLSVGLGLTYAQQKTSFKQTGDVVDDNGQPINGVLTFPDQKSRGGGFGLIAGLQYSPTSSPDITFGASVRTPISVGSNSLYEVIPGFVMLNAAYRLPGLRSGRPDYAVVGAQSQTFFGGKRSLYFDRKTQSTWGLGVEYSLFLGNVRLPLRIGYLSIPSGGDGFASREGLTYGLGYRPAGGNYSFDANFMRVSGGSTDLSLTVSYRFH
ncbi:hypothetical protein BH11ARM2_BH11ARM2_28500 [soil metagenome]